MSDPQEPEDDKGEWLDTRSEEQKEEDRKIHVSRLGH